MKYSEDYVHPQPRDSYCRQMDSRIFESELPYGYDTPPPPADTGDFDQARLETKVQYPKKHGRAV